MIYYKCIEECLMDDQFLHFFGEAEAESFVKDFFFDDSSSYYLDYINEFGTTPGSVYDQVKTSTRLLRKFITACLRLYGFDVEVVDLNIEPHHIYRWDKDQQMYVIENPDG